MSVNFVFTVTPSGGFTGSVALTATVTSSPTGAQSHAINNLFRLKNSLACRMIAPKAR
jgi:hypothetical protein